MIAVPAPGRTTNKDMIEFSTWQSLMLGAKPLDFCHCYSFHTTLAAMPRSECCQSSWKCYATTVNRAGPFNMPCSPRKTGPSAHTKHPATVATSRVAATPAKILALTRPPQYLIKAPSPRQGGDVSHSPRRLSKPSTILATARRIRPRSRDVSGVSDRELHQHYDQFLEHGGRYQDAAPYAYMGSILCVTTSTRNVREPPAAKHGTYMFVPLKASGE